MNMFLARYRGGGYGGQAKKFFEEMREDVLEVKSLLRELVAEMKVDTSSECVDSR
jgi:hypothetical protein